MTFSALVFSARPAYVLVGLGLLALGGALAVLAWRRRRGNAWLEALRWLGMALVFVTLCLPTWVAPLRSDLRSSIVVLADATASMDTRDVAHGAEWKSRREALDAARQASTWKRLESEFTVTWKSFGEPGQGTDLGAALDRALRETPKLRAVFLLSDGDANAGENPAEAAARLRLAGVPVLAAPIGQESRLPDLAITRFWAPSVGVKDDPLRLSVTARNALPEAFVGQLTLRDGEGIVATQDLRVEPGSEAEVSIPWTPRAAGRVELTVALPTRDGEARTENNEARATVEVKDQKLRVLVVEGPPRWEFRYLRNALARDPGVSVECVLFHPELGQAEGEGYLKGFPATPAELTGYDVVFLGDAGLGDGELRPEDLTNLRALVEKQSSGLVFLSGPRGRWATLADSPLAELLPVTLDPAKPSGEGEARAFALDLTTAGRSSVLTQLAESPEDNVRVWRSLPGFQWHAPVLRSRPGATVLAAHESKMVEASRLPLIVTRPFGRGKALFLGTDGVWRWRRGVEDRYHYRFWGQVARWMAYQRKLAEGERSRLMFSPDPPRAGAPVFLTAHLLGKDNAPLDSASARVEVIAPDGSKDQAPLRAEPGGWGVHGGAWTPKLGGAHQLTVVAEAADIRQETSLNVEAAESEPVGDPARPETLGDIARASGGRLVSLKEIEQWEKLLAALPNPQSATRRIDLWRHPAWLALVVGTLTVFWILRKRAGLT